MLQGLRTKLSAKAKADSSNCKPLGRLEILQRLNPPGWFCSNHPTTYVLSKSFPLHEMQGLGWRRFRLCPAASVSPCWCLDLSLPGLCSAPVVTHPYCSLAIHFFTFFSFNTLKFHTLTRCCLGAQLTATAVTLFFVPHTKSCCPSTYHSLEMPSEPGRHLWLSHQTRGLSVLLLIRFGLLLPMPSVPKPAGSDGIFPLAPWQDQAAGRASATALWNILTGASMCFFGVQWGLVRYCCLFFLHFTTPNLICCGLKSLRKQKQCLRAPLHGH